MPPNEEILFLHVPLEAGLDDVAFKALVEWSLALLVHPPLVEVVAGLLMDDEGAVARLSKESRALMAGLVEFPGGKIEFSETPRQALVRELKGEEELSIDVNDDDLQNFGIEYHRYPEVDVRMHLFIVRSWRWNWLARRTWRWWLDRDRLSEVRWLGRLGPILDQIGHPCHILLDPDRVMLASSPIWRGSVPPVMPCGGLPHLGMWSSDHVTSI